MLPDNGVSRDDLDRAIRSALHVDTDRERLARLEQYWRRKSQKDRQQRVLRAAICAAAGLVAIIAFAISRNREDEPLMADAPTKKATDSAESEPIAPHVADTAEVAVSSPSAGRPPTAYERLMFAARSRTTRQSLPLSASVEAAIRQLAENPDANVGEIVEALKFHRDKSESLLLGSLRNASESEQIAIVRLLAVVGTRQSIPRLLELNSQGTLRDDVAATVERIVGVEGLAEVVKSAPNAEWCTALMLRMLTAESEPALVSYLSLVNDGATYQQALRTAENADPLPVNALMALLDHDNKQVRLAAAKLLGHVNGPQVAELLIARVTDQPADSQEAWLALLSCRGELAEQFFAQTVRQPQLLGYYNGACLRWSQMLPQ